MKRKSHYSKYDEEKYIEKKKIHGSSSKQKYGKSSNRVDSDERSDGEIGKYAKHDEDKSDELYKRKYEREKENSKSEKKKGNYKKHEYEEEERDEEDDKEEHKHRRREEERKTSNSKRDHKKYNDEERRKKDKGEERKKSYERKRSYEGKYGRKKILEKKEGYKRSDEKRKEKERDVYKRTEHEYNEERYRYKSKYEQEDDYDKKMYKYNSSQSRSVSVDEYSRSFYRKGKKNLKSRSRSFNDIRKYGKSSRRNERTKHHAKNTTNYRYLEDENIKERDYEKGYSDEEVESNDGKEDIKGSGEMIEDMYANLNHNHSWYNTSFREKKNKKKMLNTRGMKGNVYEQEDEEEEEDNEEEEYDDDEEEEENEEGEEGLMGIKKEGKQIKVLKKKNSLFNANKYKNMLKPALPINDDFDQTNYINMRKAEDMLQKKNYINPMVIQNNNVSGNMTNYSLSSQNFQPNNNKVNPNMIKGTNMSFFPINSLNYSKNNMGNDNSIGSLNKINNNNTLNNNPLTLNNNPMSNINELHKSEFFNANKKPLLQPKNPMETNQMRVPPPPTTDSNRFPPVKTLMNQRKAMMLLPNANNNQMKMNHVSSNTNNTTMMYNKNVVGSYSSVNHIKGGGGRVGQTTNVNNIIMEADIQEHNVNYIPAPPNMPSTHMNQMNIPPPPSSEPPTTKTVGNPLFPDKNTNQFYNETLNSSSKKSFPQFSNSINRIPFPPNAKPGTTGIQMNPGNQYQTNTTNVPYGPVGVADIQNIKNHNVNVNNQITTMRNNMNQNIMQMNNASCLHGREVLSNNNPRINQMNPMFRNMETPEGIGPNGPMMNNMNFADDQINKFPNSYMGNDITNFPFNNNQESFVCRNDAYMVGNEPMQGGVTSFQYVGNQDQQSMLYQENIMKNYTGENNTWNATTDRNNNIHNNIKEFGTISSDSNRGYIEHKILETEEKYKIKGKERRSIDQMESSYNDEMHSGNEKDSDRSNMKKKDLTKEEKLNDWLEAQLKYQTSISDDAFELILDTLHASDVINRKEKENEEEEKWEGVKEDVDNNITHHQEKNISNAEDKILSNCKTEEKERFKHKEKMYNVTMDIINRQIKENDVNNNAPNRNKSSQILKNYILSVCESQKKKNTLIDQIEDPIKIDTEKKALRKINVSNDDIFNLGNVNEDLFSCLENEKNNKYDITNDVMNQTENTKQTGNESSFKKNEKYEKNSTTSNPELNDKSLSDIIKNAKMFADDYKHFIDKSYVLSSITENHFKFNSPNKRKNALLKKRMQRNLESISTIFLNSCSIVSQE